MIKFTKISLNVLHLIVMVIFLTSCTRDVRFEKTKWVENTDPIYPSAYRAKMLKDLTSNHKLIGLSYSQLIAYIGDPDSKDTNAVVYRIVVDYGSDIDPVYSKNLQFSYSKDSIITSFKILEWKK
jgi:hypothetical protein